MANYPQFIDNKRKLLSDTLKDIASSYNTLSIATGYWDLSGTLEIIDEIENYESIRLLIGKEPIAHRLQEKYKIDMNSPENIFPDADIKDDLENKYNKDEVDLLRKTVKKLVEMIENKRLEVKIFREPRLHAKAYIFGRLGDGDSIGIIGSSNFTGAGLKKNVELNFLTNDYKIVEFEPKTNNQENGHLTWFNELWESSEAIEWSLDFSHILKDSPLGNYTYGAYDVYIKTLMEIFEDELTETLPFGEDITKILHPFQEQNATSLRRKLKTLKVAMLSDSVGLGKTITAAAIIKQYLLEGHNNIIVLPPAALKKQWIDELQNKRWGLIENRDFQVISQQDFLKIEDLIERSTESQFSKDEVNLFVIDEAHNLRNQSSSRYQQMLSLLQENPNSHVLLLTATPINNSLIDFANQIQLGAKGNLTSKKVPFPNKSTKKIEYIEFFDALKRIQSEASKSEKKGEPFDWNQYKETLISGIRHYLVRSTRQGVEQANSIRTSENQKLFPKSKVKQFTYSYSSKDEEFISMKINKNLNKVFEGLNPLYLNLNITDQITQRSSHPLDIFNDISMNQYSEEELYYKFGIKDYQNEKIFEKNSLVTVMPIIYKIINFLGFVAYKPDTYALNLYKKDIGTIREIKNDSLKKHHKIRIQLSIHNMLHVTWLKRLESSTATLMKSVKNYMNRLNLFKNWLDRGYIVSLSDAALLTKEYDEDIEKAFEDYETYIKDLDNSIENGTENEIKRRGIERKEASDKDFNLKQLYQDINRDMKICKMLEELLIYLSIPEKDGKILNFKREIINQIKQKKYGNKILIFSFFSDTVNYLSEKLPELMKKDIPDFDDRVAFITGNSKNIEGITKLFSPKSKDYKLKKGERELNFLFATDVLSEGHNLQDAGILINYDLHWNPVRMIQRNGRINRLGSHFDEILILNARPHEDLEFYLNLVKKLERKIITINNTIGNDQSILGEAENPIEFNDLYNTNSEIATSTLNEFEKQDQILDWVDNYSNDLRVFLDSPENKNEIERILKIPIGKWNFLPKKSSKEKLNRTVLGLFKTQGYSLSTSEQINDIGFVKIEESLVKRGPFSSLTAKYISEQEALELIKTTPEDNQRLVDNISLNRAEYIERGITEINVQFETIKSVYTIKPAGHRALESISKNLNTDLDLLNLIENGIKLSNEQRTFEKLVSTINKQIKEIGFPYMSTINDFQKFINDLEKKGENIKLEKTEGILYYVER